MAAEPKQRLRASNYASCVGRVGALAVALGIGTAIATGHGLGVARADDDPPPDNSQDTTDTTPAGGTEVDSTSTPPSVDPLPTTRSSESWSPYERIANIPKMIFNATGGAHTSGVDRKPPRSPKPWVPNEVAVPIEGDPPDARPHPKPDAAEESDESGPATAAPHRKPRKFLPTKIFRKEQPPLRGRPSGSGR